MWKIETNEFIKDLIPHNGNKYLTGNGYFGVRGTLEEYTKENMCAINMAGVYDRVGDAWRESVNAPNPYYTYTVSDGVKYALPESTAKSHYQSLDYRHGIHTRKTVWETPKGNLTIECERFACMPYQHLTAMKYTVSADFDGEIEIVTGIDGDVWDINGPHFTTMSVKDGEVSGTTGESKVTVTVKEKASLDFECEISEENADKQALKHIKFMAKCGEKYTLSKLAAVTTSVDDFLFDESTLDIPYDELKALHIEKWEEIWDISEITIGGDDEAMQALNYSIYHLNCIAPRNMKNKSIAARGLSGQVYKGAVFWDTEMFMIDYYIHTEPQVAKTLIEYRIDTINGARTKAKEYGLDGAYYAWESQEGGYEACSDFNITDVFTERPMRTHFRDKQYHVSAAVVYAIMKYIDATLDKSILKDGAMEVMIECAMMYRSLLLKKADSSMYEIHDVVGPDEYHERVDNNAYTNRMAKFVFESTVDMLEYVESSDKELYNKLLLSYDLDSLKAKFVDSRDNIFVPAPDSETGLIEQFEGYFSLEDASIDEVRSRLLHPKEYWGGAYGVATQTQILKQADVVAMMSMFKDDYSVEIMKKNYDFYEPRTEHGSSLSACMYSLLSCYIGDTKMAYPMFMKSASADLNTGGKEWIGLIYIGGTHPASEGGAWIVAVKGFAGIRITKDGIECNPVLPEHWTDMSFKLRYGDKLYKIEINKDSHSVTEV